MAVLNDYRSLLTGNSWNLGGQPGRPSVPGAAALTLWFRPPERCLRGTMRR